MSCGGCAKARAAIAKALPALTPAMKRLENFERALAARKRTREELEKRQEARDGKQV